MRSIFSLIAVTLLGSCAATPTYPGNGGAGQARLAELVAGKVAGPPVNCLPAYNMSDMTVIDDNTIAYRRGAAQVYVGHMRGPCSNLSGAGYALVTRQFGSAQTCSGDIAQVIDTTTHMTVGSCVFGEFTPYSRPR
jgi:hypothetical protein